MSLEDRDPSFSPIDPCDPTTWQNRKSRTLTLVVRRWPLPIGCSEVFSLYTNLLNLNVFICEMGIITAILRVFEVD